MCQGMPGMEILARRGIATIPPCFDFNAGYQFNWGQFNWGQFNWGLSLIIFIPCPLLFPAEELAREGKRGKHNIAAYKK